MKVLKGSHHVPPPNQQFFAVDEWNTKEDTGKSIKNAMCVPKGTSQVEVISNSEKNQAHSLSHCRVMLV